MYLLQRNNSKQTLLLKIIVKFLLNKCRSRRIAIIDCRQVIGALLLKFYSQKAQHNP